MTFVTEDLRTAVTEAEEFEKNSKYKDLICGKYMKGTGVTATNFNEKLKRLKPYLSEEDIVYYRNFYDKHSKGVCCLPKGHSGSCKHKLDSFIIGSIKLKIADCYQVAGNDYTLFANRSARYFPILVNKYRCAELNEKFEWSIKNLAFTPEHPKGFASAVPVEYGATGYITATAYFDFAAILMLQKGIKHKFSKEIESKLLDRAKDIVKEFKQQGIRIVRDGYLCCPVEQKIIEPEWYKKNSKDERVQFGHVVPLKSDKFMTRGGNLVPITKTGNSTQGDRTIPEVMEASRKRYMEYEAWLNGGN